MWRTRFRRLVGLCLLFFSLFLLFWGLRNFGVVMHTIPILPEDMRMPTPDSLLWQIHLVI
jgi:hypothetical protein